MRNGTAIWHCISPECRGKLFPFLSPDFVEPPDKLVPEEGADPFENVESVEEINDLMRQRPRNLRYVK